MRKGTGLLLALCASMWLTPSFAADWPNFRGGAGNTGASTETLTLPLTEVWHSVAPSVEENGGVVSNGIVYMSSDNNLLYAFHVATGLDVAGFPVTIGQSYGTPAVDSANGKVYSLSSAGLLAFNLNGTAAWTATMVGGFNPNEGPVIDLGYVYVKDSSGVLYKYDSAGALQWSVSAGGGGSQPSILGGYVYSNDESGSIRKFDKATGTEVTTGGFPISTGASQSSLAVANGRIFHRAALVYAYNADNGALLWSQAVGYGGYSTVAVSGGAVYAYGYDDAKLYAFDEVTGAPLTGFPSVALHTGGSNFSSPMVAGDKVFVGAGTSQKLVVLGAAGSAQAGQVLAEYQLYSADTQGFDTCSPIISDGYVFAMLDGGGLYAFYAGGGTAPTGALSINDGDTCTASAEVTLTLDNNGDTNIVEMRISEDSQFSGVSWETFSATKSFTLSEGFGTKAVYAQFRNESGQLSNVFTAQIDYSESCTATPPPVPSPAPSLTLQTNGMGAGWFGSCGMVVGHDGKGPMSGAESAGMIALYFALLLLPVGILKIVHRKKRFPLEKTGIVALLIVASMLVASSAHAVRLIAPKAQRFHPTMDGLGALTVDTDQTLCPGHFNFGTILSGAKKPLDMGDINGLKVQKVVVDELYTADLTLAYGITPDITLGLDVPVDFSRDNLNYADYLQNGAPGVRDDVFHLGDIRMNAKFRVIDGGTYGLAIIPFVNFDTGDKDYLLSEGKFGFGMKLAGHIDVTKPLALYANLGVEQIGEFVSPRSPNYYTPWIQYGVGAKYLLPWGKDSIVAEVNGETPWATPFRHSTLSPVEVLAAYRTEIARGLTLQAGGGGGLNKGMGAPQWRAILGLEYKI
jgi:outer membrane protein assembly factor BamB